MATTYKIPYDESGNMLHYPHSYGHHAVFEWRENEPFSATLTIMRHQRGRSAAYFLWQDIEGTTYPMFMVDFVDMLFDATVIHGKVQGRFVAIKRGSNYGLTWNGNI